MTSYSLNLIFVLYTKFLLIFIFQKRNCLYLQGFTKLCSLLSCQCIIIFISIYFLYPIFRIFYFTTGNVPFYQLSLTSSDALNDLVIYLHDSGKNLSENLCLLVDDLSKLLKLKRQTSEMNFFSTGLAFIVSTP